MYEFKVIDMDLNNFIFLKHLCLHFRFCRFITNILTSKTRDSSITQATSTISVLHRVYYIRKLHSS